MELGQKYGAAYLDKFIEGDALGYEDVRSFLLWIDASDPEMVEQYMEQVIYGHSGTDKGVSTAGKSPAPTHKLGVIDRSAQQWGQPFGAKGRLD
jgi:hypothetical protein